MSAVLAGGARPPFEPRSRALLGSALPDVVRHGAAHLPGALTDEARSSLTAWATSVALERATPVVGEVAQIADCRSLDGDEYVASPAATLAADLVAALAVSDLAPAPYLPNEATIMAYEGADSGITAHRDRSRYRWLIAVFSLTGHADFEIVVARDAARPVRAWRCGPGDVVLMRAPGLGGIADGRPMHRVGACAGRRISLTLRMDVAEVAP